MSMIIGYSRVFGGGGPTLTLIGSEAQTSNASTHTFSAWTMPSNSKVLVGVISVTSAPTAVTVSGNSATNRQSASPTANSYYCDIWEADTTGGSGNNIVVTHGGNINRIIVIAVNASTLTYQSGATSTPAGSASNTNIALTTSSGNKLFCLARADYNASITTTWTGATEVVDALFVSTGATGTAAINNSATGGSPENVNIAIGGFSSPDIVAAGVVYA